MDLTPEDYKYVLTQPCPDESIEDSINKERKAYDKWNKANEIAKCYIMASICSVLQTKHQEMITAKEIMDSPERIFAKGARQARQVALCSIMFVEMKKETKVRDHVLHVMNLLNEVEGQRVKIDEDTQIDMLMETLPEAFDQFKVNYNMYKMKLTMTELMNELHSSEEVLIKIRSINMVEVKAKPRNNGSNANKKQKKKAGPKRPSTKKDGKRKGKCFKCREKGH